MATRADIVDPDLAIVDAHHHLWPAEGATVAEPTSAGQGVPRGTRLALCPPYSLADLRADAESGHRVVGTVFVECSAYYRQDGPPELRPLGETATVSVVTAGSGLCQGIVGYADLTLGRAVGEVLDLHADVAGPRFRGVRNAVAWDPDDAVYSTPRRPPAELLAAPGFREGAVELAARGLVFDTWSYFHQLEEIAAFARAHEELTVVLEHLGGPAATGRHAGRRAEVMDEWRSGLATVSRCGNVVLKLGAVGMHAFSTPDLFVETPAPAERIVEVWGDDLRHCIDLFGPSRCMFESNFPVDAVLCDYPTLWNAFKIVSSPYDRAEREQLFAGTAMRTYGLELGAPRPSDIPVDPTRGPVPHGQEAL